MHEEVASFMRLFDIDNRQAFQHMALLKSKILHDLKSSAEFLTHKCSEVMVFLVVALVF